MKRVIVIGAGASGIMSGICAARANAQVTILEAMEKPGKKVLVTGNGRCNITNSDFTRKDCYRGAEIDFIQAVLEQFDHKKTKQFFEELGLILHSRNGGFYPITDQAQSVLDVLLMEAKTLKIKLKYQEKVVRIYKEGSVWKVKTNSWCYEADAVILSCGSKAAPVTGSDGSGYQLAKETDHNIIEPLPALVPLVTKEKWISKLAGLRTKADVTLQISDQSGQLNFRYHESGELQWTEYGISGIVVFQLSRYAVEALTEKKRVTVFVDLLPEISKDKLEEVLINRKTGTTASEILTGILPKKMVPVILEQAQLKGTAARNQLTTTQVGTLVSLIKQFKVHIQGYRSFEQAQVCMGGVDTKQVDCRTLESKMHSGLYFAGELLDVDGICGGYNLQWAWSSGYVAGTHCVQ